MDSRIIGKILDKYLIPDITDIILSYSKKTLSELSSSWLFASISTGWYSSFDDFIERSTFEIQSIPNFAILEDQMYPVLFRWMKKDLRDSPSIMPGILKNWWNNHPDKDCLAIWFANGVGNFIPVSEDEYEKVYKYLKSYFGYL